MTIARFVVAMLAAASVAAAQPAKPFALETIKLPRGFHISLYAAGATDARSMAMGSKGTLFVGTMRAGVVYAIIDRDHDGVADEGLVIAGNLRAPNGVAFRDGALYVSDAWRILRYDKIEENLEHPPKPVVIYDGYPHDAWHGWKYIGFGPDGWLYVPVGAPCNVCRRSEPIYATITRIKPDGSGREIYAEGIRNTVGFDWNPATKELWFTDNGRDWMGDDSPPDELNRAPKAGLHFGFPFCHGGDLADPQYGKERACSEFVPPERKLGPHVAALGMRFYTGTMFPEEYRNQIFIAEHGSWNRSHKIGYRVTLVRLKDGRAVSYEPFATGWLENEKAWGRPVDVRVAPDGALLVSDDEAGAIYRIGYAR